MDAWQRSRKEANKSCTLGRECGEAVDFDEVLKAEISRNRRGWHRGHAESARSEQL